jgi:regulatory protein
MPPARPASLKVRALQWLAQREHSRSELREKLLHLLERGRREAAASSDRRGDDGGDGAGGDGDGASVSDSGAWARPPKAVAAVPVAEVEVDPETEVEALLAWLEQRGYLSDARFAEVRVQSRQARYGNQRIRQELRQRGVTLDEATEAVLAGTEFNRACVVWQRKYDAPAADAAGRLRQMRFLVGRGFSMAVVQRVLRQAGRPDDEAAAGDGE